MLLGLYGWYGEQPADRCLILKPIIEYQCKITEKNPDFIHMIKKKIVLSNDVELTSDPDEMEQAVLYGDSVLLADGSDQALILNTKGWTTRATTEPENEKVMRGPREGFNESLMENLSMLRRRLQTRELCIEFNRFGTRSKTRGCICYVKPLVKKKFFGN